MHSWSRTIIPVLMTCLAQLSVSAHGFGAGTTAATLPVFGFKAPASEPVIEYSLRHHMLADHDHVPLLRVYGDGRLLVHRPAYMKNAGDFALQLQQAELAELIRMLADKGILDFDVTAANEIRCQTRKAAVATKASSQTAKRRFTSIPRGKGPRRNAGRRRRSARG